MGQATSQGGIWSTASLKDEESWTETINSGFNHQTEVVHYKPTIITTNQKIV
jgi:hypothetical protein